MNAYMIESFIEVYIYFRVTVPSCEFAFYLDMEHIPHFYFKV